MPIDQDIKDRAHSIDPACWVSYSGRSKDLRRMMDARRNASLEKATAEIYAEKYPWYMEYPWLTPIHGASVVPGTTFMIATCGPLRATWQFSPYLTRREIMLQYERKKSLLPGYFFYLIHCREKPMPKTLSQKIEEARPIKQGGGVHAKGMIILQGLIAEMAQRLEKVEEELKRENADGAPQ